MEKLKRAVKDGLLPFLIMFLTMGVCIVCFRLCKEANMTEFLPAVELAGEETNPTYGRLIWCVVSFILTIILTAIAGKTIDKDNINTDRERLLLPWTLSVTAGTLLWQSFGECMWHFGLYSMNDEGESIFINFPRIECLQGIPMLIVFAILFCLMYGKITFNIQLCLAAFLANWYGHVGMIGTYPIAVTLGSTMDMASWHRLSGAVHLVICLVIAILLMFNDKSKRLRYMSAIALFIAYGNLVYGVILAET